jgi:hypothetical protein
MVSSSSLHRVSRRENQNILHSLKIWKRKKSFRLQDHSEGLGDAKSKKTMLGLHYKISFERRIDFGGEVGKIVGFGHFASKRKKTITT